MLLLWSRCENQCWVVFYFDEESLVVSSLKNNVEWFHTLMKWIIWFQVWFFTKKQFYFNFENQTQFQITWTRIDKPSSNLLHNLSYSLLIFNFFFPKNLGSNPSSIHKWNKEYSSTKNEFFTLALELISQNQIQFRFKFYWL